MKYEIAMISGTDDETYDRNVFLFQQLIRGAAVIDSVMVEQKDLKIKSNNTWS